MWCLEKTTVSTGFEYRKYTGDNSMVPIKITRGTNLLYCQGKGKLAVTLWRAHGVSCRSFETFTVQLAYGGNLPADDAGLLNSTMEMVLPSTIVRTTEFLMCLMGQLLSEEKLNAPEARRNLWRLSWLQFPQEVKDNWIFRSFPINI